MRSSIFALVLLSALLAPIGLAMRYEPREPDPKPYQLPCDVVSIWTLLDSLWIDVDDSQTVRRGPATQPRRGDQWLTVCDVDCDQDNFEQAHPRSHYLVNDERHSDTSSQIGAGKREGRLVFWATLLDDWYQTCGDLNGAIKRL